jgi:hypothetical protein
VSAGLEPILCLTDAPAWAKDPTQSGEVRPSAKWYGRFAHAAAIRYSGHFGGLPRVRYWQALNEPNLEANLAPARVNGSLFSPDWYRGMVNAFAHGVKAVDPTNLVIAGGLAPYAALDGPGIPPITFMRASRSHSTSSTLPRHDRLRHLGDAAVHLGRPHAPCKRCGRPGPRRSPGHA